MYVALAVFLDFVLRDGRLVAKIILVEWRDAQFDLKHGHDSCELKVVKSFFKGLVLVVDGDVGDLVDLVQTLNAVLNELGELHSRLHCV